MWSFILLRGKFVIPNPVKPSSINSHFITYTKDLRLLLNPPPRLQSHGILPATRFDLSDTKDFSFPQTLQITFHNLPVFVSLLKENTSGLNPPSLTKRDIHVASLVDLPIDLVSFAQSGQLLSLM